MKTLRLSTILAIIVTFLQLHSALAFSFGDPPVKVYGRRSYVPFSSDYVFEVENTSSETLEKVKVYINSSPIAKGGELIDIGSIGPKSKSEFTISKEKLQKHFMRAPGKDRPAVSVHVEAKGFLGDLHLLFLLDYKLE
ncbi:MAG: hypothetical protein EB034_12465 [Verrucomicrobia bacterium]|nr:hypothetical protein [Verrucomicrobiota bacterium]